MKKILIFMFICFAIAVTFSGCYYDKAEQVYPQPSVCDTVNMKYSIDVVPILQANCYVCHGGTASGSAGRKFDTHALLSNYVANGKLVKAITHSPGATPMPYNLPKMSDCNINKILDWVNRGALDN
jgi:hypothetical protein